MRTAACHGAERTGTVKLLRTAACHDAERTGAVKLSRTAACHGAERTGAVKLLRTAACHGAGAHALVRACTHLRAYIALHASMAAPQGLILIGRHTPSGTAILPADGVGEGQRVVLLIACADPSVPFLFNCRGGQPCMHVLQAPLCTQQQALRAHCLIGPAWARGASSASCLAVAAAGTWVPHPRT